MPDIIPALPKLCALFFETHDGDIAWQEITSALRGAGFDVRRLRQRHLYCDGFAVRF